MDPIEHRLRARIRGVFSSPDRELDESVAWKVEDEVLKLMRDYVRAPRGQRNAIYAAAEKRILNALRGKSEPSGTAAAFAKAKPTPEGYHSVTPYLIIKGAADAIEYYKKAFGATEQFRMAHEGKVGHAEIKIGDSPIMIADEYLDLGYKSPTTLGGTPVSLMIYVEDVDTIFNQALSAGGEQQRPLQDQFYGDRSGTLKDPFGHVWHVATHVENVPAEEIEERAAAGYGCDN